MRYTILSILTALGLFGCGISEEQLDTALADIAAVESANTALSTRVSTLDTELFALANANGALEEAYEALVVSVGTLEERNAALEDRDLALAEENGVLAATVLNLDQEKQSLEQTVGTLAIDLDSVQHDLDSLNAQLLTVGSLTTEIANLRVAKADIEREIEALIEEREPLIPELYTSEIVCTGSMDPLVTCLDQPTFLANFNVSDIVEGVVISFLPIEECNLRAHRVLHRVIDIKTELGQVFFLPKGDNNQTDDGCWIPAENINGYVVELSKRSDPIMDEHLERIWALEDEAEEASLQLDIRSLAHQGASQRYTDYIDPYCGNLAPNETCFLSGSVYDEAVRLFDIQNTLYDEFYEIQAEYEQFGCEIAQLRRTLEALRCSIFGCSSAHEFDTCN